jgi:hypothetical protein
VPPPPVCPPLDDDPKAAPAPLVALSLLPEQATAAAAERETARKR